MASSSSRSTEIESKLRNCYQVAFTRLWSIDLNPWAERVTAAFASALEIGMHDLRAWIEPSLQPSLDLEIQAWEAQKEPRKKVYRSDKVHAAVDAVADAGNVLAQNGREAEGDQFLELAKALHETADTMFDLEMYKWP